MSWSHPSDFVSVNAKGVWGSESDFGETCKPRARLNARAALALATNTLFLAFLTGPIGCETQAIRPVTPNRLGMQETTEHEAAVLLGRRGGSAKTPAKAAASRANGAKGGRPAKWKQVREEIIAQRPQCERCFPSVLIPQPKEGQ